MKQYRTFVIDGTEKTVGKDIFDASFIGGMTPEQLLAYQIDVMQWYRDGGEIQICNRHSQSKWTADDQPTWSWVRFFHRAVPESETTDQELTNVDKYTSDVKTKLEYLIDSLEDIDKGVRPKNDLNQANFMLGFVQAVAQALINEAKGIQKLLFEGEETNAIK